MASFFSFYFSLHYDRKMLDLRMAHPFVFLPELFIIIIIIIFRFYNPILADHPSARISNPIPDRLTFIPSLQPSLPREM